VLRTVVESKQAPPFVFTCETVISEALFLLKRDGHEADDLFGLVVAGLLRVDFAFHAEYVRIRESMRRYRDRPMSYADACLVRMAELRHGAHIWTLDRDFQFYRMHRGQVLTLRAPW
jgi:predicted nucleic acid-binding protein